jgi:excisionase family DNA binding protein
MPYKLNKIIFQRDYEWGYESYTYDLNTEMEFPFAAGMLQELVPKDKSQISKYKPEISDTPLFNEKGLGKLVPDVGPKGIYYLEIRSDHKLRQLFVEPDEVIVDIYFGAKDTLIYSFYNPTRRNTISITAAIEKDTEGVHSQIKAEPDDLIWRHYFVQRALLSTQKSTVKINQSAKIDKEILTADEAANYLRMKKKTLQNYVSESKIKSLKGGKFRRKDLEEFMEHKKKK